MFCARLLLLLLLIVPLATLSVAQKNRKNAKAKTTSATTQFTLMNPGETGVHFVNNVPENDSLHVFLYEYLYNGHGIGVADFNSDGLDDLYFSGNAVSNKLYLNKGDFLFEDITEASGAAGNSRWATGVSIADVNGDKLPDIYVCHSGYYTDSNHLSNQLFINMGVKDGKPVFQDMAKAYRLDAPGTQSTQAAFFDYDLDGDLDMFLLNHSNHTYNPFLNTRKLRAKPDFHFGNRLFRNDQSRDGTIFFTDVTLEAGIINNALNFGLGVKISDLNGDGWPDIYSTSDYTEQDCYYVNNRDGTFTQSLENSFGHISRYSMGADIADYNNDGLPDVLTLDMLPEDNHRQKLLKGPDEYDQYHLLLDSGYYHQQMRNMLHLNMGVDPNGHVRFSEIGQLAGISNTDWSWSALIADFDNDGWKDVFVTNGYLRDYTDLDFLKYTVAETQIAEAKLGNKNFRTFDLVKKMPSNKLSNYLYRNNHDLTFTDVTKSWGLHYPAISNGAAYSDLDNDGDLDLIVCNNNELVMLFRNNQEKTTGGNSVQIKLEGKGKNTQAIGAKVEVYADALLQVQEQQPVKGYQSTVSASLNFGLNQVSRIDSIRVRWPVGTTTTLKDVAIGKELIIREEDTPEPDNVFPAKFVQPAGKIPQRRLTFTDVTAATGAQFRHLENAFIDFKDEVLLPYQLSTMGPALATGDVNGDRLSDFFVGGAIGQPGVLFIQQADGKFVKSASAPWNEDAACEDVSALFFDCNNDGFPDLYVVSGGNEYADGSPEFADRLYLNNGHGQFTKTNALPPMANPKKAVAAADFDNDGDLDLFVSGAGIPGSFPYAARSYLLRNDSRQNLVSFTDITLETTKDLLAPGMVMAATWADLDDDKYPELIIAGDWMPVQIFRNTNGNLQYAREGTGLEKTDGMWTSILAEDMDNDGDIDFVLGNCGTNNQFKPDEQKPMIIFANDFDENGTVDPIVCYHIQGQLYPMASRDELLDQIVPLRKKFIRYIEYADATIEDIFDRSKIRAAKKLYCYQPNSSILINQGDGSFQVKPLPVEVQFTKMNTIVARDFNKDGIKDLLFGGNFNGNRVQLGRYDASMGALLLGKEDGTFQTVSPTESGLYLDGEIRAMAIVENISNEPVIVIARNNDEISVMKMGVNE